MRQLRDAGRHRASGRLEGEHPEKRHRETRIFIRRQMKVIPSVDRNLVVELHFVRRKSPGKLPDGIRLSVAGNACRHPLGNSRPVKEARDIAERLTEGEAAHRHLIRDGKHRTCNLLCH